MTQNSEQPPSSHKNIFAAEKENSELRDEELLKILRVDPDYYYELVVEEYLERIRKFVYGKIAGSLSGGKLGEKDVDDIVQKTFLNFYERLQHIEKKPFKKLQHLAYLRKIAWNIMLKASKKTIAIQSLNQDGEEDGASTTYEMEAQDANAKYEQDFRYRELLIDVETALESMKEPYKKVLQLRILEEYSYEEIVSSTGYSLSAVKSYIKRGREQLWKCLKNR